MNEEPPVATTIAEPIRRSIVILVVRIVQIIFIDLYKCRILIDPHKLKAYCYFIDELRPFRALIDEIDSPQACSASAP